MAIVPPVGAGRPLHVEASESTKGVVSEARCGVALCERSYLSGHEIADLARAVARRLDYDTAGSVVVDVALGSRKRLGVFDAADAVAIAGVIGKRRIVVADHVSQLRKVAESVVAELP